ncbi:MAG: 1-acyl-sn-glycerol-3-phosphate acyltransferase [Muribaculaceae bacterium]|nr:1-acyl-sn-glycerol-3-phosphate acyltransferase [Muribaculaceae bacterium]MDE6558755.1 1-acyl-sn-glycerol-3-phosphate acyltransferase [Muribaculaceae bacterium]
MNIWKVALKLFGWTVRITAPYRDKCVICVAPHTSNWDFIAGLTAYKSLGRNANFLMKKFWFFWPLKYLLKSLGGIPVESSKKTGQSLVSRIIQDFKERSYMNLAVTPEGTRSRVETWRSGFLQIAMGAQVPIQLGVIDFKNKLILIEEEFTPTGNVEADISTIKKYYSQFPEAAKYPEKFAI